MSPCAVRTPHMPMVAHRCTSSHFHFLGPPWAPLCSSRQHTTRAYASPSTPRQTHPLVRLLLRQRDAAGCSTHARLPRSRRRRLCLLQVGRVRICAQGVHLKQAQGVAVCVGGSVVKVEDAPAQ